MSEFNLSSSTNTGLDTGVSLYSVKPMQTEGVSSSGKSFWDNRDFTKWHGYYKQIPELKAAIQALANWTVGKGFQCDSGTRTKLNRITGMGEDTFSDIMWNMIVTKKVNGDAYAEIIRDEEGTIINIKPLDPSVISTVVDDNGRIMEYQVRSKVNGILPKTMKPNKILHLMNDRFADEIKGTSVIQACEWVILARNEAMNDWRRISHRSTIRVMYDNSDDNTRLTDIKNRYKDAINKGELIILPAKKEEVGFEELTLPPIDAFLSWIKYTEDFFYTAVGVPKVVLGGSSEFTEASSKIALVTYDQAWHKEQTDLQDDLWNQCGILLQWNAPASLMNELISAEDKNTGQVGFQQNDVEAAGGKTNVNG